MPAGAPQSGIAGTLAAAGASALVIVGHGAADPDLARWAGAAKLGDAFVVAPADGAARLGYFTPMERDEAAGTGLDLLTPEALDVARWTRDGASAGATLAGVLARALQLCGVGPGRVALAGCWPAGPLVEAAGRLAADGWSCVSGNEISLRLRRAKTAAELEEIRRVSAATGEAFRAVAALLGGTVEREGELWLEGEPLRVARLKREVARRLAVDELTQPRANILAPGEEGGVPHSSGTPERILRAGDSLVVDLFPKGRLFSDCTRTFCVGRPSEALAAAHAAVRDALAAAHAGARPGASGWTLQEAICRLLADRGYPTPITHPGTLAGYVHGLGHGVGYELHEYPSFKQAAAEEGILAEGDVLTLEPGLYDPTPGGGYGVRLEDLVHLGAAGVENLTPLPYDLDPRAWG